MALLLPATLLGAPESVGSLRPGPSVLALTTTHPMADTLALACGACPCQTTEVDPARSVCYVGDCGAAQPLFCYNCGYQVGFQVCHASPPPPPPLRTEVDEVAQEEHEYGNAASTSVTSSRATLLVAAGAASPMQTRSGANQSVGVLTPRTHELPRLRKGHAANAQRLQGPLALVRLMDDGDVGEGEYSEGPDSMQYPDGGQGVPPPVDPEDSRLSDGGVDSSKLT